jgi:phosphatidylglycerol:prolipoprotein diacylglycerol transferase
MELLMGLFPLAYAIDLGWLRIGPPYIYINIDPVLVHLGPLAIRWYGLMYVVAILIGLWIIQGYTTRKGIDQDMVYRVLWWCIAAGLIGGRLYFVIQQQDFVQHYLLQPQHILATWEGGMAFYGAIFLVILALIWRARREHVNPLVLLDAGVLFAAAGQIFGRIGNLINGDIIGYPSTLPWSTVYQNPNSWACLDPSTCNVPVQPAAGYEMLGNIIVLALMLYLASKVRRPGVLLVVYLFCYTISQFLVFFTRANTYVDFLGITSLKQAQWTSIIVFILVLPLAYWVFRYSKPVPKGEVAATYGIPQPAKAKTDSESESNTDESSEASAEPTTQENADEESVDKTPTDTNNETTEEVASNTADSAKEDIPPVEDESKHSEEDVSPAENEDKHSEEDTTAVKSRAKAKQNRKGI